MCGDNIKPEQCSQYGAVAVIHRASPSQQPIRLLLGNPSHPATAVTRMLLECADTEFCEELSARIQLSIQYVIYRTTLISYDADLKSEHGDLRSLDNEKYKATVAFSGAERPGSACGEKEMDLRVRLLLCVGDDGVIGRMVSVMIGKEKVGDGVIGWNRANSC